MVGYSAGSGVTAQHEIADIAKATRKLTFSGGFFLVDELQRRTNPRVEISPYSVVFIIPLPGKLVRR